MKELIQDLLTEQFGIIPVKKNKSPALSKGHGFLYERIKIEEIDKYFTNVHGIAIVCGEVSCGVELLDFDDHKGTHDIEKIFRKFCSNPFILSLINSKKVYIQQTPSGGYHFVYRYKSKKYDGNRKLAHWEDKETMIETRGQGGYFVTAPTLNYKPLHNDYFGLATLDEDERNLIIEIALEFEQNKKNKEKKSYKPSDPISFYNYSCGAHARNLLRDEGWICTKPDEEIQKWRRPGKDTGISATWGFKDNMLYVFSSNAHPFTSGIYYSPFEILAKLKYRDDWKSAQMWVQNKYLGAVEVPYVRIGTNYFKIITKPDRFGVKRNQLKAWTKDEIKTDYGTGYLKNIPQYDDFIIEPNNKEYSSIIDNCYNLYKPFPYSPVLGEWKWTRVLLEHIFGEQYDIGIRYIQSLYQNPKRVLPILVLGSKDRSTGKTTFLNWLNMMFGHNMVIIDPHEITGSFNEIYATANIIAVEETFIEKKLAIEKIKSLSTGKFIVVNQKYISHFKIPFYGHIIMTTNEVDRFMKVDEEEIRFFIRKLNKPKMDNFSIEDDLINEIPGFLNYLNTLPELDYSKSRALFTPEELQNEQLQRVKNESRTGLYKDLSILIENFFDENDNIDSFYASALDIKHRWFESNNQISPNYIIRVLNEEFNLESKKMRYNSFESLDFTTKFKQGRVYFFEKKHEDLPDLQEVVSQGEQAPF